MQIFSYVPVNKINFQSTQLNIPNIDWRGKCDTTNVTFQKYSTYNEQNIFPILYVMSGISFCTLLDCILYMVLDCYRDLVKGI